MTDPILLLHGALGSATQLDPLKQLLKEKGVHVYSLNLSNHGGRPASPKGFGIEVFADEVLDFLNRYSIQRVQIFGYSMGGYVALWFAHHHPEKVSFLVTLGTKFDWTVGAAEKEVKKLNPEKIAEKVPAFAKALEERHHPEDWKMLMNKTANMMIDLGIHPLLTPSILKSIQTKTLLCLGDADDMVDRTYSEKVAELLPNADFKLLPSTPHPIERTDLTLLTNVLTTFFV
jgi:pimeloyl-ACP methyl ester carboxylesterase